MLNWIYLPILKWKQGDRIALSKLTKDQREGLVPVLELPAINAAHDAASLRVTLVPYIAKLVKEMERTFTENQVIGIDTRWVATGYTKQISLLAHICKRLQAKLKCKIAPVISETALMNNAIDISRFDAHVGYILRIQTVVVQVAQIAPLIKLAIENGLKKHRLHIVIDQYAIVKDDPAQRHAAVTPYIDTALAVQCASVTVAGGSFPVNLMGYKQGQFDIPRVEWQIWQLLQANPIYESLRFSDYTVSNPGPLPDLDPTQMNPSVQIRYAAEMEWKLYKAGGFKKGAPNQYRNLCKLLILDRAVYKGPAYSDGDDRYDKAAAGKIGNGNPSSWRRDATSHHLVLTREALQ